MKKKMALILGLIVAVVVGTVVLKIKYFEQMNQDGPLIQDLAMIEMWEKNPNLVFSNNQPSMNDPKVREQYRLNFERWKKFKEGRKEELRKIYKEREAFLKSTR